VNDPTDQDAPSDTQDDADGLDPFARAGQALDDAAVRWLRLRDRAGGMEDDLLILPVDLAAARLVLAGVGFREVRHPGRGSHRAFFGYDEATDGWPKLDVVTGLDFGRWQEWRTDLAEGVVARRERGSDGARPASDDAFWTLLLHELLDRPGAIPHRADRLRELAASARPDGPGAHVVAGILPPGWSPERVIGTAAAGDQDALAGLGRALAAGWTRRSPVATRWRRFTAKLRRRLDAGDPPFIRRGLTVALLGPDGAGKSTLSERLGTGGPLRVRRVYLGLYGGSRRAALAGSDARPATRFRFPGLGTVRRVGAMWRGWLVGAVGVRRGRLVVFDRHPYDARLGDSGRGLRRIRRAILGHALPAPDVVIVLDAPAELLFARKPEHPVERIDDQRRRYLALARDLPATAVVDVSGPLDDVARRITAIVWGAHAARGGGR
jgi:thymidylate kinase